MVCERPSTCFLQEELTQNDRFLRDYLMNKGWVDQDEMAPVARPRRKLLEGEEEDEDEGEQSSS